MRTSEWWILISFIWLLLGLGFFIQKNTLQERYFQTIEYDLHKLHPFFRGEKMSISNATFKDFLWIDRLSTRQQERILDHMRNHPSDNIEDLLILPSVKIKTIEKLKKYFY